MSRYRYNVKHREGCFIGRQCSLLTGLHNTIVRYPSHFCTKKIVYLTPLDVKQKRCKVPCRKRNKCRYLLELTAEESKFGLDPEKEQKYRRLAESRKRMKDEQ